MPLYREQLRSLAHIANIQLDYRKHALEIIKTITHELMLENQRILNDEFFNELEKYHRDWIVETVIQGMFLREYHLWENDTKEYISTQLKVNTRKNNPAKSSESHVEYVKSGLTILQVIVPTKTLEQIDEIRIRCNKIKHSFGVRNENFINLDEIEHTFLVFQTFWKALEDQEIRSWTIKLPREE